MKHILIRYKNGAIPVVHFDGVAGVGADYTLCGDDTAGDTEWYTGEETKKRVTCERCQNIVKACKKVLLTELSSISR